MKIIKIVILLMVIHNILLAQSTIGLVAGYDIIKLSHLEGKQNLVFDLKEEGFVSGNLNYGFRVDKKLTEELYLTFESTLGAKKLAIRTKLLYQNPVNYTKFKFSKSSISVAHNFMSNFHFGIGATYNVIFGRKLVNEYGGSSFFYRNPIMEIGAKVLVGYRWNNVVINVDFNNSFQQSSFSKQEIIFSTIKSFGLSCIYLFNFRFK